MHTTTLHTRTRRTALARALPATLTAILTATLLAACVAAPEENGAPVPAIVPAPAHVDVLDGAPFRLEASSRIVAEGEALAVAELLATGLRLSTGFELPVEAPGSEARGSDVTIVVDADAVADSGAGADEGYTLTTGGDGAHITAATPRGAFWGAQSLRQLLPPEAFGETTAEPDGGWVAPALDIEDAPRFAYRGTMLDVARHFRPVEDVEAFIDAMVPLKLNVLHLHLSDDQGWRLEIEGWPELTGIGASTSVGGHGGGFYTQDDYRRIVAYAAERYVTVVPEFDLPGHTNAALSAYPELNCDGVAPAPYEGVEVGFSSLCASDERAAVTDRFLADVIGQLAELTPGPWLHLGGDESLSTPEADYRNLVERMTTTGAATGKTVIGWHEIGASSALPPGTVGQYWDYTEPRLDTGAGDDARSIVAQGGQIVLSPADVAYLDMEYLDNPQSKLGHRIGNDWAKGATSIDEAYGWEPTTIIEGVGEADILGIEAPLWAETLRSLDDIELMAFPRLLSIAEIAWSPAAPEGRDHTEFLERVASYGERLDAAGVTYHRERGIPWRE